MKYDARPLLALFLMTSQASITAAIQINFSSTDFTDTPVFSSVTTYDFSFDLDTPYQPGLVSDPLINDIQYTISGSLAATPSGFPAFLFRLDHIFPSSPPITGLEFYALNASSVSGGTLQFSISATANLADGLQVNELDVLTPNPAAGIGSGVVFHFNGREEGTGRYHPAFIQLFDDGTGIIQNANNFGGTNPTTNQMVDLEFGEEYITQLAFDPASLTIGIPEPSAFSATFGATALMFAISRRRKQPRI